MQNQCTASLQISKFKEEFQSNLRWHSFQMVLTKQVCAKIKCSKSLSSAHMKSWIVIWHHRSPLIHRKISTERSKYSFYLHCKADGLSGTGSECPYSHTSVFGFLCFTVLNVFKSRSFGPLSRFDKNVIEKNKQTTFSNGRNHSVEISPNLSKM